MLVGFFQQLRQHQVPVSLGEFLSLLQALQQHLAGCNVDEFYYLARTVLVKDERHYDRFDQAFAAFYRGQTNKFEQLFGQQLDQEWLQASAISLLSEEERAKLEALGWDKLFEELQKRLAEQKERHSGGNKWIGTGGTSPFGHSGYNPEGIRIGGESRNRRAVKVWEQREFRNLDDQVELGTRNIKLALRKLRRFAREGAASELDMHDTISATAQNAGYLDLKMVPERHNAVKVLLLLDVGGSMDDHVRICEELFSAVRAEFKHLEVFYFHNCVYEWVWRDNRFRHTDRLATLDVIHTYGRDYKLIFVGDASMSPYEILQVGGSIEHWNEEAGAVWMRRLLDAYPHAVWLNPLHSSRWGYTHSVELMRELLHERMYCLTLAGLEQAIVSLKQRV